MYAKYLDEIRNSADKIRKGEMSEERKSKREQTRSLLSRPTQEAPDLTEGEDEGPTFEELMVETFAALRDFEDNLPSYDERQSESGQVRPKGREDYYVESGLTEDPAFMAEVERLQGKYPGLTKSELFRVIQGESGFNPRAQNPNSKAAGLFQFIPSTAADLGFTTEEIKNMAPAEQLRVYDMYLDKWGYKGGNALGIMQAAPAYANAGPNEIIYERGTKAWEQNPGWRGPDGEITVASINNYYRSQ